MVGFKGFKTKEDARAFIKQRGNGLLCYNKSNIEPKGKYPQYYEECVVYGGLSREEYPYAVQYNLK